MRQPLSFSVAIAFCISMSSFTTNGTDQKIEVVFTHELKYTDLVRIKQDLAVNGISIEYSKLEFGTDKKLKRIEFTVNCNDGYSGSANTGHLTDGKKFGFYRDYDEDAKIHFYAGYFK